MLSNTLAELAVPIVGSCPYVFQYIGKELLEASPFLVYISDFQNLTSPGHITQWTHLLSLLSEIQKGMVFRRAWENLA